MSFYIDETVSTRESEIIDNALNILCVPASAYFSSSLSYTSFKPKQAPFSSLNTTLSSTSSSWNIFHPLPRNLPWAVSQGSRNLENLFRYNVS
jgi:hypothetical protein